MVGWAIFGLLVIFIAAWAPARIYVIKGQRDAAAGRYQQAVNAYQRAIRLSPNFARAYVELGDANRQLARYDEAEKAFKQAMALEDESCTSCGLGVVYWKTGRYAEAEKAFKHSTQLNPNDVCAYDWSGRMYYELGRYEEAIKVFDQELKLTPNVSAYLFLGNAYIYSGKPSEAVNVYRQAIRLDPDKVMAYTQLGFAYESLGRYDEAIKTYQLAIRLMPNEAKAHYGLARAYLAIGDKKAALAQSRTASGLDDRAVYFIPLGDFSSSDAAELATYYKKKFDIGIVCLPAVPLDPSTFDDHRNQLIAEDVIDLIKRTYPKLVDDPDAIVFGLTDSDMYVRQKTWRFAFSYSVDARFAVVSNARMNPTNLGQPASAELLNTRFRKMVMKNIGVLYYQMPANGNPKSVLYNKIDGIEELDRMGEEF
jgi:tetratricopeptide (TPR) repeat protein